MSGPLQFGPTRIFGSHADASGLEVQVFEREEDALRWLDGTCTGPGRVAT